MLRKMVLGFACLLYPLIAFAVCPKEKHYVQLEDLIFDPSGIWLHDKAAQQLIGVEALRSDSRGLYVEKKGEQSWMCPKCGKVNPGAPYGRGCTRCSWPYDGDH